MLSSPVSWHAFSVGRDRRLLRRPRGFTLIELICSLALIALLAAIVLGSGRRAIETGQVARARAELSALGASLEAYRNYYGDYPQIGSDGSVDSAESGERLYAALNGQRGPLPDAGTFARRQRAFVPAALTVADPAGDPVAPHHFVDPWGEPYHYCYEPGPAWKNSSCVLFSAGPDREATLPFPSDGFRPTDYERDVKNGRPVNVDNLFLNE
jgi:prepilin-type N-terminal cleavage/methylation domain-containing protein